MNHRHTLFFILLLAFFTNLELEAKEYKIRLDKSNMITMRDGVKLSTDLYFPEGAKGKLPVVMIRTPYSKKDTLGWNSVYSALIKKGYVLAIQDIRGRFESEGSYIIASKERQDAYDTVDWLITQPWSNQKVGTAGCSYLGETQVALAAEKHPNHLAAIPMSSASGFYVPGRAWQTFSGGVFELAQTAGWFAGSGSQVFYGPPPAVDRETWFKSKQSEHFRTEPKLDFDAYLKFLPTLPTSTILSRAGVPPSEFKSWITSLPDGDFYRNKDYATPQDSYNVPAIFMDSWYDYGAAETIEMFHAFQKNAQSELARNNQYLIIAPGTHCDYTEKTEDYIVGERNLGNAALNYIDIQLAWYDYWLKGDKTALVDMPRIQYYLMGKNEWRSSDVWPLKKTTYRAWYLAGKGKAQSSLGDGKLVLTAPSNASKDTFIYDPGNPMPSLGGHTCCTGSDTEAGGYDQSEIELRKDMLVYSSEILSKGLEVTGTLKAVLYVSSSALDTDFTVKLIDVYPDGHAFNIQEGAVRMRYRESLKESKLMTPREVYKIDVDLNASSNYFAKGHKIRIEVSSSNFPRWDRNLNTGGNNYDETEWIKAENTIFHSERYPSHLLLPVIDNKHK